MMFQLSVDDRISSWANLRGSLAQDPDPLTRVAEFWSAAPYVPYNRNIDPFDPRRWPTPWEIIADNQYDDFTKAVMIGWTLKYSDLYRSACVEIRTMVDKLNNNQYNLVCIDDHWIVNYTDNKIITTTEIPETFYLENLIELKIPR